MNSFSVFNQVKDINARLERIEPQQRSTDGRSGHQIVNEVKASSVNPKKSSPRAKAPTRENSLFGGENLSLKYLSLNIGLVIFPSRLTGFVSFHFRRCRHH